jgi:hypothetical protein
VWRQLFEQFDEALVDEQRCVACMLSDIGDVV